MALSKQGMPVCLRADQCVARFAEAGGVVVRVPLDQIGALWLNRRGLPVSGKYVHNRWRTIMEDHGFAVSRYRHMILVRCDRPEHRQKLREHNERFCNQDPLLPSVCSDLLLGSISKTHLAFGLKCFKARICWDHSGLPMIPAGPSKDAIAEHIENGMLAIVLDGNVLIEDPEGVEAIMVSENLDNDQNLPEHEVALLKHVRATINTLSSSMTEPGAAAGVTTAVAALWPQVKMKVTETLGGRWKDDDIAAAYNLAMVLDDKTISELVDAHQLYINPTLVIIRMSFLNAVAQLDPYFRKVKLCIIIAQYLCEKKGYEKHGKMLVASLIKEWTVVSLAKLSDDALLPFERFMEDMLKHYEVDAQMQDPVLAGSYMSAKANLYARTGKLLAEKGGALAGGTAASAAFGIIEAKFIAHLHQKLTPTEVAKLPTPMLQGDTTKNLSAMLDAQKQKIGEEPTIKPLVFSRPVQWAENGEVDKTVEYQAESQQMPVGGGVALTKACKIGPKGRQGIVKAISLVRGELCADVEWDEYADYPTEARVKLEALQPCEGRPKKKARTDTGGPRAVSDKVVPYVPFDANDATEFSCALRRRRFGICI